MIKQKSEESERSDVPFSLTRQVFRCPKLRIPRVAHTVDVVAGHHSSTEIFTSLQT